jgi:hypothetical protein
MMMIEILAVLAPIGVYLWLCWFIAKQFYEVAQMKGYTDKKYFWITFWLGPVGYFLVIALPNRNGTSMAAESCLPRQGSSSAVIYGDLPDL